MTSHGYTCTQKKNPKKKYCNSDLFYRNGSSSFVILCLPSVKLDELLSPGRRLPLGSSHSCIQRFLNLLPVVPQGQELRPNNNMPHLRKEVFVDYTAGFYCSEVRTDFALLRFSAE